MLSVEAVGRQITPSKIQGGLGAGVGGVWGGEGGGESSSQKS